LQSNEIYTVLMRVTEDKSKNKKIMEQRFTINEKRCPKCEEIKSVDEYHQYFSKSRKKWRIGNYCKPCARKDSKKRVKIYFEENKEERLRYARDYRKKNPKKVKKLSAYFTKKYREELQDCYVAEFAAKSLKCSTKEIHDNPELLEAYRTNMKIKRKIKKLKDGKK